MGVFADNRVRADAGARRNFCQRRNYGSWMNAIRDYRKFAQQARGFGEGDLGFFRAQQGFARHGNVFRHDHALRRRGRRTFYVPRRIHENQIARRGALRRRDTCQLDRAMAFAVSF